MTKTLFDQWCTMYNSQNEIQPRCEHIANLTAECFRNVFQTKEGKGYYKFDIDEARDLNANSYQDALYGYDYIDFEGCTVDRIETQGTSSYNDLYYFSFPAAWLSTPDTEIESQITQSLKRWVESQKVALEKTAQKQKKDDIAHLAERAKEFGYELTPMIKVEV